MANDEQLEILREGFYTWNRWRVQKTAIKIDLRCADLSEVNLSFADLNCANLRAADLSNTNLSNTNLSGANLSFADLSGANLSDATLRSADLSGADLSNATLRDATLRSADLSGANLSGANLSGANLSNADLSNADLSNAKLFNADLFNAVLRAADLRSVDLRSADLSGANLSGVNLSGANLSGASLSNTDLSGANLSGADLSGVNLSNANLFNADLSGANLSNANLILIQSVEANFSQTNMTGTCIQDWHINSATNFEGVKSDYIYRGYDEEQHKFTDRLPVNIEQNFKVGEFEHWINIQAEARQTIDLTFTEGIDWQSFFSSLQGVRKQYPDAGVGLQAIEKKGSAFVIRLETATDANKSAIEATQKELYETQLKLHEARIGIKILQEQLDKQRDSHKDILETMVRTMSENQGKVTQNFNATVGNVAVTNDGEMKAIQHNYAGVIRQTPAESAKEIQDLLLQLQQRNPADIQALVEQKVKSDPTLRDRIRNALKEGGLETMKVIFPLTGIAIETVRGWVEAEGS